MADSFEALKAKILKEATEAAEEAIDATADDIIQDATWAAEVIIYSAYSPKKYQRRHSFTDEGEYFYQRTGLRGYVAPDQTPNPEGDPPPTMDKNLPLLIETGEGGSLWRWGDVEYARPDMNVGSDTYGIMRHFTAKHHTQRYDYLGIEPRPWWSETMESVKNQDYLIVNCKEALARHGITATVS